MQRLAPLLVGVMMTWVTAALAQTPDYIIQLNDAPLKTLSELQAPPPAPAPNKAHSLPKTTAGHAPRAAKARIGLLLPTESRLLGEAATVVRSGFEAAAATDQSAEVMIVDASEHNVASRYRQAVAAGVTVMVGPLSRSSIAAVAPQVTVPTLALNSLDKDITPNAKLYSLSLTVEGEARQMARVMHADGRRAPLVILDDDALSRRLQQAFAEEWRALTGMVPASIVDTDRNPLEVLTAAAPADGVFLALEPLRAAKLKPQLAADQAVYATSQVNTREPDQRLAGIRFIDMPWFLMAQHPAVKRYPRPTQAMTLQTERLYALGIDAYRMAVQLARSRSSANLRLDGVTGDLRVGKNRVVERQLPVSIMGSGN